MTVGRPFVKGQSGNPGGRPKRDWTWASLYEEEVQNQLDTKDGKKVDARKAVAMRLIKMAIDGDIQAIRELTNRMDGMPVQKNVHAGDEENPIKLDITATLKKAYGQRITKTTRGVPKNSK